MTKSKVDLGKQTKALILCTDSKIPESKAEHKNTTSGHRTGKNNVAVSYFSSNWWA